MKNIRTIILSTALTSSALCIPATAFAQQDMMALMQEMTLCMQNIDRNEIKAIQDESMQLSTDIKNLCQSGKTEEAQQVATEFSNKAVNSLALKTMQKCMDKMPENMKGMLPTTNLKELVKSQSKKSVCGKI